MGKTVVVGIDPSLTNTAIVHGTSADDFTPHCCQSTNCGDTVAGRMERIARLMVQLEKYWPRAKSGSVVTFLEGYAFAAVASQARYTAEYGGVLRHWLSDRSTVYEVAPTTLKKFCTGKGKGDKTAVVAQVTQRYRVTFSTHDEYDAYGLFRLGLCCADLVEVETSEQQEACDTVLGRKRRKASRAQRNQRVLKL